MKLLKQFIFILLLIVCFSQTVFAHGNSENFVNSKLNSEITHSQTVFDNEKDSHEFVVTNSNSELSQIYQRKKIDLGNSNTFTASNFFSINEPKNKYLSIKFAQNTQIKHLFLSEYSPHAP